MTEKEEDTQLLGTEEVEESIVFTESPSYINGTMRHYQIEGLNWLVTLCDHNINGILADEMGLGKTLQSISLIGYMRTFKDIKGPHLFIVPKSTLHNWKNEFKKWLPEANVFVFHGDKSERIDMVKSTIKKKDFDVCITSFEVCMIEKSSLKSINWEYIVIDEAHRIKNEQSLLSKVVRLFNSKHRLLLTGTPLQNNLHELWALLNFLLPDFFSESDDFDSWFSSGDSENDGNTVKQLQRILKPFLLRRLKSEVEHSLLPKKEINLYVGMSEMQRKWYKKLLEKDISSLTLAASGKKQNKGRLMNIVMQLRKCCNHPYLFDGAEPEPFTTGQHLIDNSGKMVLLDRLLEKMKANGSRVLLFSQMSRVLDILEDYCYLKDYKYCRLDGQTDHEDRIEAIDDFNRPNSDKFIFLLTTRAGGLGINLATADIVILFDSDWNPQVDLQAQDRAHRIGQTKQVFVFRFITEKSIEERVIERAVQKLRLDQIVVQSGKKAISHKSMTQNDLVNMIYYGAEEICKDTANTISNESIEDIIRTGEEKTQGLLQKYEKVGLQDLQKFSSDSQSAYQWEGADYRKKNKNFYQIINLEKRGGRKDYTEKPQRSKSVHKAPRPPKQIRPLPHQFFNPDLEKLLEKETLAYQRSVEYVIPEDEEMEDEKIKDEKKEEVYGQSKSQQKKSMKMEAELQQASRQKRLMMQEAINNAEELTKAEEALKEKYISEGFSNWSTRDFNAFIKGCQRYGRSQYADIATELEDKSEAEVKRYAEVFWSKGHTLPDFEKNVAAIEKGEEKLKRDNDVAAHLKQLIESDSLKELLNEYHNQTKTKHFNEIGDGFLLREVNEYGPSDESFDLIRMDMLKDPLFRFDWHMKSRTVQELSKRYHVLMQMIERDMLKTYPVILKRPGGAVDGLLKKSRVQ